MRNRYLDLLRAAAIVRVIVYHLFGWPWLSILLPAMGIMFALAGSLAAGSLEKRAAGQVITSRLRRLLPPLWLLGLVAVPVMLVAGWARETDGEHPFSLPGLVFWILPVSDPPGSELGIDVWEPLWYIRAYVWFILLSPVLYAFYRKTGWLAVASPILLMAVLDVTGLGLPDAADAALWDFVTYGACWIAGFAHHDGRLARVRPWVAVTVAVVLGAAALYWLRGHPGEEAWDLNDVSESQALWSIAFVLLALRWQPPMAWLARFRPLDRTVTLLNARAVTVYLWHNIAIAAVWPVLTVVALDDLAGDLGAVVDLSAAFLLTVVAILVFGWVEDLAARRAPRLWPTGGPAARKAPETAKPTADPLPASWPPAPRPAADRERAAVPVSARSGRHAAEAFGGAAHGRLAGGHDQHLRLDPGLPGQSRPGFSAPSAGPGAGSSAAPRGPGSGAGSGTAGEGLGFSAPSEGPAPEWPRFATPSGGPGGAAPGLRRAWPVAGRPPEPAADRPEPITGEIVGWAARPEDGGAPEPEWFRLRREGE